MRFMKTTRGIFRKGMALTLVGVTALCLAACGTSSSNDVETSEAAENTELFAEDETMTDNEIAGEITEELSAEEETSEEEEASKKAEVAQESITFIGDSVMLGAAPALQETFENGYVDAAESRQVYEADEILASLEQAGNLAPVVVIALGTNGPFNSASTGQALIDQLGSDREIYWVTAYGATLEWQEDTNAAIQNVAAANENVKIIDWAAAATEHSEWFYNDGIHLKAEGQQAYADVILEGLLQE